ncbi:DUF5054 domain-containing protein [Dictyobacter aurantiacus]|uniref:Glycoside hydrolase n=1 Tax=Dictyobacter aurantiacus TaxID=1936993 RepID=A0A401ZKN1_9CHLR|nr:DUF5054 domain-containing protein [Dictyobacter aurantiacus]GCE07419.1 hypothetical protein KDAU_47480 [Dictyobacter aurantiacus]
MQPAGPLRIHVVFKTHLDAGFTELAEAVRQRYFTSFFPQALETARQLRERGGPEGFIWTTGSWILSEYLAQAMASERTGIEEAIAMGDLAWHGLPFTLHSELLDTSLFEYGLSISQELDRRFGKTTVASKMSDVPGHTRAIVPLLAEAGIQFLHIGVNAASTPPDVPTIFNWHARSGHELLVMYQPGSYGDLTLVPGTRLALAFAHTQDNMGPQTVEQVLAIFAQLRERFPQAEIFASTLDAFALELLPFRSQFPTLSCELGDTWIHGVGSDPLKVAQFRALSRLRRRWMREGRLRETDASYQRMSNALLQIPEHTWGLDEKTYLDDYDHYLPADVRALRQEARWQLFESSWREQRSYIQAAVQALGDSKEGREARLELARLRANHPDPTGFQRVDDPTALLQTRHFELGFDEYGSIAYLRQRSNDRVWAAWPQTLACFWYELFSQHDYERFWQQYVVNKEETFDWSFKDFTKPGIEHSIDRHQCWLPRLSKLSTRRAGDASHVLLELEMPAGSWQVYGAPRTLSLELRLPDAEPIIEMTLQWFDKQANRLPEALWFSFQPRVYPEGIWHLHKLGDWISPLEVVSNGNRTLHAVDELGVRYNDERGYLRLETLDAPLLAPGQPSLLNFTNRKPLMEQGVHFNLYNNIWGTNFPMWYEEDARFRFTLRFEE